MNARLKRCRARRPLHGSSLRLWLRAARFDQLQWIISMIVIIHGACIVMYPPKKLYMILRPIGTSRCIIGSTRWGTMYTCVYYVYFLIRNNLGLKMIQNI